MSLDPDAARVIELANKSDKPPFEEVGAEEARRLYLEGRRVLAPEPPLVNEIQDMEAPGPDGAIPVRYYRPVGTLPQERLPVLVYFHGGGWVIGSLDSHDVVCRRLANAGRCAVVSVDYRMAPEHRFPAAVEDCMAATEWVSRSGELLRIDTRRLAVGGDSAGGNLAAAVALMARDTGAPAIVAQVLFYPATDFDMSMPSHKTRGQGYLLTTRTMEWFRDQYFRGPEDGADWRASPIKAANVAGVAPAYVLTAGYDPLCDEGEAYARKLVEAGVMVTMRRYPGQIHGFLNMGKIIRAAGEALDEAGRYLKGTAFAP